MTVHTWRSCLRSWREAKWAAVAARSVVDGGLSKEGAFSLTGD